MAFILVATLHPQGGPKVIEGTELDDMLIALQHGDERFLLEYLLEAALNVLLFVPLGAALWFRALSIGKTALCGFALSALIECAQLVAVPGRTFSLDDVLLNTFGAALGHAFFSSVMSQPPPAHRVGIHRSEEGLMALARVVSFEGVSKERVDEMKREMDAGERPEGVSATEFLILHDPATDKSLAILFFETEDDYTTSDAALNAMPATDTPGRRTSVTKYDVVARMTV